MRQSYENHFNPQVSKFYDFNRVCQDENGIKLKMKMRGGKEMRKEGKGGNAMRNIASRLGILSALSENISEKNHEISAYRLNLISDKKSVKLGAAVDTVSFISSLVEMVVLREFSEGKSAAGILYSNAYNNLSTDNKLVQIVKSGKSPSQSLIRNTLNNRVEVVSGVNAIVLDIDTDFVEVYPAVHIFLKKVLELKDGFWLELTKSNRARVWIFVNGFEKHVFSNDEISQILDEFYKLAREFFAVFGCKLDISWIGNFAHDVFVPEVGVKTENGIVHGIIVGDKYNGKRHDFFEIYKKLVKFLKDGYKIFFSENGELIRGALEHRWSKEKLSKNPSHISKTFYENLKWYFGRNHEILTKLGRQYARKGYSYLKKLFGKELVSKVRDIEKAIAWFMYQRFGEEFTQYLKRAVEGTKIEHWREFRKILESFKTEENVLEFDSDKRLEMFRRYVEIKSSQHSSNRFINVMLPAAGVAKALELDFDEYESVIREYLYDKRNLEEDIETAWEYAQPADIDNTKLVRTKRVSFKHIVITMDRVVEYVTKLIDNLLSNEEDQSAVYYDEKDHRKYVRESYVVKHICDKFQITKGEYYYVVERLVKSDVVEKDMKSISVPIRRRGGVHNAVRKVSVLQKGKTFATNIEQIVIKYAMNRYSWFQKDKLFKDFEEYAKHLKNRIKSRVEKILKFKRTLEQKVVVSIPKLYKDYVRVFESVGFVPGLDEFPLIPERLYRIRKFVIGVATVIVDSVNRLDNEEEFVTKLEDYANSLKDKFGYKFVNKELISYVLRGLDRAGLIILRRAGNKGYRIDFTPLKTKRVYTVEHLVYLILKSALYAYAYSYISLRKSATYLFREYLNAARGLVTGIAKSQIEKIKFFIKRKYEKLLKYDEIKEQLLSTLKLLERGMDLVGGFVADTKSHILQSTILLLKEFEKFNESMENGIL
jgi:hypothetical protein